MVVVAMNAFHSGSPAPIPHRNSRTSPTKSPVPSAVQRQSSPPNSIHSLESTTHAKPLQTPKQGKSPQPKLEELELLEELLEELLDEELEELEDELDDDKLLDEELELPDELDEELLDGELLELSQQHAMDAGRGT